MKPEHGGEFADLELLVRPRSVAVVGASDRPGLGGNVTRNLLAHSRFEGAVHLVSKRSEELFGRATLPSLEAVAEPVDVVLVVVPREQVPGTLRAAQACQARFAIVMSAGFGEAGDSIGATLDREIREVLGDGLMRVVGPNCPGIADIARPLGLTLQPGFKDELVAGPVGLIAQSGGLTRCILQASQRGIGFSYFFSPGNQVDLDIADFANFLVEDDTSEVIALAVEHFPSSERFVAVAERAHDLGKGIALLKTGASDAGREAAASHTGAIVGTRAAMEAVARRHGITLVDDVNHLVNVSAHRRRASVSRGGQAVVFGMSGGAGVVVTDALAREGVSLAKLAPETTHALRETLPEGAPVENPLDISAASFSGDTFKNALRIVAEAADVGVVLILFNAWYEGLSQHFADACLEVVSQTATPLVPVWMSSRGGAELEALERGGLIPCLSASEGAVVARALLDTGVKRFTAPVTNGHVGTGDRLPSGLMLEAEAKRLLGSLGIAVSNERSVRVYEAAVRAADEIGYPVIAKVIHAEAAHRAGTGLVSSVIENVENLHVAWAGLQLAVAEHIPNVDQPEILIAEFVRGEVEAFIGVSRDDEWGPMVSMGLGGRWIEVIAGATLVPAPTTQPEAAAALRQSRLNAAFDLAAIPEHVRSVFVDQVVRIGNLAAHEPRLVELDVNPIIISVEGATAVDALVRVD